MDKLLFIVSSPKGERSYTSNLADTIITELLSRDSARTVDHLNLWEERLPPMSARRSGPSTRSSPASP